MRKEIIDLLLLSVLGSKDLVNKWWQSPNKAFNNKTPEQQYQEDQEEVITYITSHTRGEYF